MALFVAFLLVTHYFPEKQARVAREIRLPSLPEDTNGVLQVTHSWEDLSITSSVSRARLTKIAEAFGVPRDWHLTYGLDEETMGFHLRFPEWRARSRGLRVIEYRESHGSSVWLLRPSYPWLVDESHSELRDLARALEGATLAQRGWSSRELMEVVASFVQSLRYAIPYEYRATRSGREIYNFGIATPLEVLVNKWGDCDSKSLLFASIMRNFRSERILLYMGMDHAFVAFRGVPRPGDKYVTRAGVRYIFVELTSPYPLGYVDKRIFKGLRQHQFQVVSLDGSGTDREQEPWMEFEE